MEPLRLKARKPVEEAVENWDDDDFMIDTDEDLTFRSQTSASTTTNTNSQSHRRDSHSSFRSDRESLPGAEERQVHLPGDDEKSTLDAIAAATNAGIPIPTNVPPSALMGGTIKRLGGRKMKKILQEDWGEDIELPAVGQALRLKAQDGIDVSEVLCQFSGSTSPSSPAKQYAPATTEYSPPEKNQPKALAPPINLDRFKDTDDDDDIFGDGMATIKASKLRPATEPASFVTPPTPSKAKEKADEKADEDDFECDLELPSDGKLKLSSKRDIPKTPSLQNHDDFDWGEGSLGTRFGGTRRDAFSNRSSSVSAMSPSIASSITAESEDETFDGLIIPNGPLDLNERLQRHKQSQVAEKRDPFIRPADQRPHSSRGMSPKQVSPRSIPPKTTSPTRGSPITNSPRALSPARSSPKPSSKNMFGSTKDDDDPFSGLDFGDGHMFRSGKSSMHRNIKMKAPRPASPVRPKTAVSITFTNKPVTTSSRLPRPMISHERSHTQSSLEPVSESGDPIPLRPSRRSQSRLSHSTSSSVSSIHTPTTPSTVHTPPPLTPRRRELGQKSSTGALRNEPTTTSAQLLRLKRSLPVMRQSASPGKPVTTSRLDRPTSSGDSRVEPHRPVSALRSKTPAHESNAALAKKGQVPFLPAGASKSQSHNVVAKSSRVFRRHDPDENRPLSRAMSRTTMRSPSPRRARNERAGAEPIWQQLSKPRRTRQFGDGHELDAFDDLPTSAQTESRYMKQPVANGNKTNIRNKIYQNVLPDRSTPSPVSLYTPAKADHLPHFARDTAASRNAREAGLAQRTPPSGPLTPAQSQRVTQLSTRTTLNPHLVHHGRTKKGRKPVQSKPHLISNLNPAKETRVINGMTYNPSTLCWEGNENALNAFEESVTTPTTVGPHGMRDRDLSTPRPLLITHFNAHKNSKRVGDMVFDPQKMCWVKVDVSTPTASRPDEPLEGFNTIEEEDPFEGIPDLEEKDKARGSLGRVSDMVSDWLVGEEFDVGPEFVRRQHDEEARWRRKCGKWTNPSPRDQEAWRWALRDLVLGG
ncbi:hypothetical protein F4780DRAFT_373590 [Xylariomycetidae sp. FL0641]|nr:hypothetical protein F4780DRAFT_373590 [Xylariomycetidae sp. FL0641]